MLLRNLVLQQVGEVFQVRLTPDSNFEMGTAILGNSFTISVRTYVDYFSYFSIVLNATTPLCIMTLGRLGVNLCCSPVTTLDGKYHVFTLVSEDRNVTRVHHSLLGTVINLVYFQCPTSAIVDSVIL